ncbi:MAG: hypothetical protein U0172_01760 [Nitrospiraceae bacterium]
MSFSRHIVCVHIPTLGIALARQTDPTLRTRPVAIAPSSSPRTRLLEVSSEATGDGVVPAMSLQTARRLCPTLVVLPPSPEKTAVAHQQIQTLLERLTPQWEPVSPGQFYLDMTGTGRLHGRPIDVAARLERDIQSQQGLAGVIGLAGNKLVSHVAATALGVPEQVVSIRPGAEHLFLEPLPIDVLPGLTRHSRSVVRDTLDDLNLHTLGAIAETSQAALESALGPAAAALHEWSRGIDRSPVHPTRAQPAVTYTHILTPDEIDDTLLLARAYELLEQVCRTLRRRQHVCRRLTLTCRQTDRTEHAAHRTIPNGSYWEHDLHSTVRTLFFAVFQRRIRIDSLTLCAESLTSPAEQLTLFHTTDDADQGVRHRRERLALAIDHLRDRFGDQAIRYGRGVTSPS